MQALAAEPFATLEELARAVGLRSRGSVLGQLRRLEQSGIVEAARGRGTSRRWRVKEESRVE